MAKHIEQFNAERRARGVPAAAAAAPAAAPAARAAAAAREGIDGWETLESDAVGFGLERGLERDAEALFHPAASLVATRAAVAAQIARDPAQMVRGQQQQRRGAAPHSKPRRAAGKPRQQSPPQREADEVLMVPKRLLVDGKGGKGGKGGEGGEGAATRALSPTPRKRLSSPRKRGNPRRRLNQLKRLLKRLDEVRANASSKYVRWFSSARPVHKSKAAYHPVHYW